MSREIAAAVHSEPAPSADSLNPLLERQIAESRGHGIDLDLDQLLRTISAHYDRLDAERRGVVRSMQLMSDEAHALTREIREETGLAVEVHGQLGVWEIIDPPEEHRVIVYSLARPIGGKLKAASDLDEVRFCHRDELDELDISDVVCRVLDRVTWTD